MSIEPLVLFLDKKRERKLALELIDTMGKHTFHFEEYDDLAKCSFRLKDYERSIKFGELALTNALTNETMWVARSNLINVYNHANYPEKAMRLIRACEAITSDSSDIRLEKAFSHFLLNERDAAEAILKREAERTDLSEEVRDKIMFNLGTYELYRDNFERGLELFIFGGQKMKIRENPNLPGEHWTGGAKPGKTLMIYAEAGIGDELISVRFMDHVKDLGMKSVWYTTRRDLASIFRASGYDVITDLTERPLGSLWASSMAVPIHLKVSATELWHGPYLRSVPTFDEKWKSFFTPSTKLRIGVRWQGNPEYDQDLHRSIPLKDIMSALPDDDHFELYSLQRDTGVEELQGFPKITDLSDKLVTFEDTMSVISMLDVVITSCTSIAHAAAAMGKRTIVIVPISAYYTWSHSTKQSPWYGDNVTLLRQVKPRSWAEPIAELKDIFSQINKPHDQTK